jgi:hypothetical protein
MSSVEGKKFCEEERERERMARGTVRDSGGPWTSSNSTGYHKVAILSKSWSFDLISHRATKYKRRTEKG